MHYHHSHTESQIGGANGHLTAYGEYDIEFVSEITCRGGSVGGVLALYVSFWGANSYLYLRTPLR